MRWGGGGRGGVVAGLALALWLAACGSGGGSPVVTQVAAWTSGPLRWLLLADEERELDRVHTVSALAAFEQRFWRRREPSPVAGRPTREVIDERSATADRLYGEPDRPGSLTDRGRALILLGAPSELKAVRRPVPVWQVSPEGRPQVASRLARVEIWAYRSADLPRELAEGLVASQGEAPAELTFLAEGSQFNLVSGAELLERAARALAHDRKGGDR